MVPKRTRIVTRASAGHYISVFEVIKGSGKRHGSLNECARTEARTRIMPCSFRVFHCGEDIGHDPENRINEELNCWSPLADQVPTHSGDAIKDYGMPRCGTDNITKMGIETRTGTVRPVTGCGLTEQKQNPIWILSPFIICNLYKSCRITRM
ncbi:hypothetical protein B0H11DRAFT_2028540 [Mycena galericulata]|nr:hypothetical protein B0H11DRAFT_2028540 [Mycena galericulata]